VADLQLGSWVVFCGGCVVLYATKYHLGSQLKPYSNPSSLKYHLRQRLLRRVRNTHRNIFHAQSIRNLLRFSL